MSRKRHNFRTKNSNFDIKIAKLLACSDPNTRNTPWDPAGSRSPGKRDHFRPFLRFDKLTVKTLTHSQIEAASSSA